MKGEYNQECNITACQKPNSAIWFNHSTRKYYCPSCARRLNFDPFNARDAPEFLKIIAREKEIKQEILDGL